MTLESLEDFIIQGAGSPEGTISAPKGVLYIDRTNAALYLKSTSTGNTDWILISADTANLANKDLSNLSEIGSAHFANPSLSNLNATGSALINSKENVSNKTTAINSSSTDVQYPTAKAVYDLVGSGTLDSANKSLSNLNQTGEDKFVHTLSQVRDCIFKAPNGLPSVSGNIISLPSGTVLLCANGVDDDNAVKNEKVTTASALSISVSWTEAKSGVVIFNGTNNSLIYFNEDDFFKVIVAPGGSVNMLWYNPNTNEYKVTSNSGSTWTTIKAAEIGRFTTNSSGTINSFYPYHPLRVAMEDDLNNIKVPHRSIGEIITSTIPLTDAELHLLDGSLLSGSGSYGAFVSYIAGLYTADPTANYFTTEADWQTSVSTYGVCGKFVYDSVNNTVRLPKVTGIVEGTTDLTALGDIVSAGLPNITGDFVGGRAVDFTGSGAFVGGQSSKTDGGGDSYTDNSRWSFNASRSSSIYGNSTTVQPQTIKVLYYIVIATSTKTDIEVDIDEIATDLNGKADVDLTNTNDTAAILMSGMAMPSDTYEDLTLGASGATYTAPANGYFVYDANAAAGNAAINMSNQNTGYVIGVGYSNNSSVAIAASVPARKGETVKVQYVNCITVVFRFIYAVGSESEAS
jgi:hypothetical protein